MNKRKIRVLIIGSRNTVKGGITSVITRFLNNKFTNIDQTFLPTYVEGKSVKKILFFSKACFLYLGKLIFNKFDIAHIHMSYKGSFFRKLIIVILSRIFNKKIVLHVHGSEFEVFYNKSNKIIKKLIKYILRVSDVVIVLGNNWGKIIKNIENKTNISVFKNSVDIPKYTAKNNKTEFNILFLGVLIKRKGIYELIDAIKILKERGIVEKYKLKFLIGGAGKEEEEIKQKIDEFSLNNCVNMLGWIDNNSKKEVLEKSQLMILPSYNEGLPMAILEAMSYGIPVVATDVGSISEVVNSRNGCLIKERSSDEIVRGICTILKNLDEWSEYSEAAKEEIKINYNEAVYFNRIEQLYLNLIK